MTKDKETFINEGKCKIEIDKEGNTYISNCDNSSLNTNDIDFLYRIKKKKYFNE